MDLSWIFRIFDRASGPADKIAKALGNAAAAATAANAASMRLTKTLSQAANAQANLLRATQATTKAQQQYTRAAQAGGRAAGGHSFASMPFRFVSYYLAGRSMMRAGESIARVATYIPRSIIEEGIRATSMKESVQAGMGVVLGDKARAAELVKEAVRFAALTPMTTGESIRGYQQLVMGGLKPDKVLDLMSAISDLSSINSDRREEAVSTISHDIMQIMTSGRLDQRHLRNLSSWGFPREEFYRQLSGGMIAELRGKGPEAVVAAIRDKRISSDAFMQAFMQTMAVKGGGKMGAISTAQSQTMAGLYSTLISRPEELLMNMDRTPAWDSLKTALSNLVNVLDYNTESGQKVQEAVSNAFSRWVIKLTEWLQDPAKVERWVTNMLGTLERLVPAFESLAGSVARVVSGLPTWLGGGSAQSDEIEQMYREKTPFLRRMFWMFGARSEDQEALSRGEVPERWRAEFEQNMRQRGSQQGWVDRPTPSGEYPGGWPGGAKGVPLGANIHVNVQGATEEGAKATADETARALASLFEQANVTYGVG